MKPLDTSSILKATKGNGAILSIEEHSKIGGLGSAVAEFLCTYYPRPMTILGANDTFGESGFYQELLDKNKITSTYIGAAIEELLRKHRN